MSKAIAMTHEDDEDRVTGVDEDENSSKGSPIADLKSLPILQNRNVLLFPPATSTSNSAVGQSTSFQPLSHTNSRRSNTSARTFADPAMLVGALPNLSREETRISKVGTGYIAEVRRHEPVHEHEHEYEHDDEEGEEGEGGRRRSGGVDDKYEIVAVQVTPDGQELTFPDGGTRVSLPSFFGIPRKLT